MEDFGVLHEYAFIDPRDVVFHEETRRYCEQNICGEYGASWACPPGIGSVADCERRCKGYNTMLLFSGLYNFSDWQNTQAMKDLTAEFKHITRRLADKLAPLVGEHLTLATGGCDICEQCTYPDAPCRFPNRRISSISGYGMMIIDLADMAGMKYNNGPDTITLFGAILYNTTKGL